ncbi:MAG: glutathione S-transferase family protein [Pseudomonadota bacterium]
MPDSKPQALVAYGDMRSGNCWKMRWVLELTEQRYRWQETDILAGASRRDAFLKLNPNGRVPLLQLPDGQCIAESNAIIHYLADGTKLLPATRLARAQVLQWQFFEQYSHEPNIAVARFIRQFTDWPQTRANEYDSKRAPGLAALGIMEVHLADRAWFVGDALTLADISLYAYTHVADEGGFDLAAFPALRGWLHRCAAQLPDIGIGR